jgi:hypothetical protein
MTKEKVREDRLRRVAARRGLVLRKVKRIDRKAIDYGHFQLISAGTKPIVGTLDEIERELSK